MTQVKDINRDLLTTAGKQVYDEYNSITADKQWLSDHRSDANFKQELVTKAPEIEKNWEKFQGDVASLANSDDPLDEREALVLNSTACLQFQQEGADLKNISDTVLFGDLQKGDADAFNILHNFRATIDQGNASLEHFQQANVELQSIARFENNYVDEGFGPGTVLHPSEGGFKSADDIHADLAHVSATTTERVNPNEPTTAPDLTSTRTNVSPH